MKLNTRFSCSELENLVAGLSCIACSGEAHYSSTFSCVQLNKQVIEFFHQTFS
jgi:hypothetical protein